MYQSWQIAVPANSSIEKKTLFKSSKKNGQISQWTIIVQYTYLAGTPAPLPPEIVLGCSVDIVGLVNGISGILNEVSASQSWVPLVGATYRAYGNEIQIGFNNDNGAELSMLVSAIEEAPVIMDGESRFADVTVPVVIPQFATSFFVAVDSDVRVQDYAGATLLSFPVFAGVLYPIHQMAYFIVDLNVFQVYAFKKGYT